MKKALLCFAAMLLLCGCKANHTPPANDAPPATGQTVTFINGVKDADVWLLPDTEANRKTTVWGTATVSGVKTDESRQAPLCDAGEGGLYLIRMIDVDHIYYSADAVALQAGWTVRITGTDLRAVAVEVSDENGVLQNTYEAFAASL